VREALFSILGPELTGIAVLELFAGSGALGFEALSRGAARATFVEADAAVGAVLSANAAALGVEDRCRVVAGAVEAWLRGRPGHLGGPYGLALADPPYRTPPGSGLLRALEAPGLLTPDARVVLQRDRKTPPIESAAESGRLFRARTAVYGRNCLDFYAFADRTSA